MVVTRFCLFVIACDISPPRRVLSPDHLEGANSTETALFINKHREYVYSY